MTLAPGVKFGSYEIAGPLGAGGMGEVYRARDTRLNRDVAIKVLPELFAADAERHARFTREAQTLAALNHPNVAAIYGIEDLPADTASRGCALVMELVDGEDLSTVLARGALPVDDALGLARQMIEALEAAHEIGIVHRDLKPANIKIRSDGTVKVLDFGLAKLMDPVSRDSGPLGAVANSPTLTARATQMGLILGTAAYMSPEQARGRAVDKRTDVWAFGCVLYEMLTGARAFDGEDATEIIAAVVKTEPDFSAFSAAVPAHLRTIVARCLVKDRKARIPDLSVVRFMLDGSIGTPATSTQPPTVARSVWIWKIAAVVFVLTTLAAVAAWYRARNVTPALARFLIDAPNNTTFMAAYRRATLAAISPDGLTVAFTVTDAAGKRLLWVRPLDSLAARPLPGTDGASYPFWSPDSRSIGYTIDGKLLKVSASGGTPQTLCTLSGPAIVGRGGTWNRDNVIVFNNGPGPLYRISANGGDTKPIGQLAPGMNAWTFPSFLPDGRHVLSFVSASTDEVTGLYVVSLDSGESKRILAATTGAIYEPASRHLLFVRQGTLLAQRFDPSTFALENETIQIAENVESSVVPGTVAFSVSNTGVLAYGTADPAAAIFDLVWVDRQGKVLGSVGQPAPTLGLDLSPDGKNVATHRHDSSGGDIWLTEVASGRSIKFTADATQDNLSPTWSPDGSRIAFASIRNGKWGITVKPWNAPGDEERVFEADATSALGSQPTSWTPDGRALVLVTMDRKADMNLYLLPLSGDRKVVPLASSRALEFFGQLSPDGKWLAYVSTETGQAEVYVQSFGAPAAKSLVSTAGGGAPRWRGDSRELFYMSGPTMMAVDVNSSGSAFEAGKPTPLFEHGSIASRANTGHNPFPFAVSKDGQRFLISRRQGGAAAESRSAPIAVVLNWAEGLRK